MATPTKTSQPDSRGKIWVEKTRLKLLRRFKRLVRELLNNCQDCAWENDDVDDYLERLYSLQDEVETFADSNGHHKEELAIYSVLENIGEQLESLVDESEEDNEEIEFDFDDDQIDFLEYALNIQDFEEEYAWEEEDDDD